MSYGQMESFVAGFEDSSHIDFNKLSVPELFGFIDKCKENALKLTPQNGPYWLGMCQKAQHEVLNRTV